MSNNKPQNNGNNDDYEVINETEMFFVSRGRKSDIDPKLIETLKTMSKGQGIALRKYSFDDVANVEEYKKHKAKTSAKLRNAGKSAGKQIVIHWHPTGYPQIVVTK